MGIKAGDGEHALSRIRAWSISWILVWCAVQPTFAAFEVGGGGAYSSALAGALSTSVESVESVWFNPAPSARIGTSSVSSTHGTLWSGLEESPSVHLVSGAWVSRWGTVQVGYATLRAQGWDEKGLLLGVSRVLSPRFALGAQVQRNGWDAGRLARHHWVGNVGFLYEAGWVTRKTYVRFSGVLANIGSSLRNADRRTGQRPRSITVGMQVMGNGRVGNVDWRREADRWELRVGYESELRGDLMVRLGGRLYVAETVNRTGHAGLGYEWRNMRFDYAFSQSYDLGSFGAQHRFGVGYVW